MLLPLMLPSGAAENSPAPFTSPLFPGGSDIKNRPAVLETQVQSLGQKGNGYPLRYSCLENSIDRGASGLQFMKSQTQFSD